MLNVLQLLGLNILYEWSKAITLTWEDVIPLIVPFADLRTMNAVTFNQYSSPIL